MTARAALAMAGLLAAVLAATPVSAERLIVSVSNHRVTVTPNYSGEELVLFGSVEKDADTPATRNNYDLVVTVAGPRGAFIALSPQLLDQVVLRDALVRVQEKRREQCALLSAADRDRAPPAMDKQRPQDAELHRLSGRR